VHSQINREFIRNIYIYYGNATATTTSNGGWTVSLMSDFEDGTKQGWLVFWSNPTSDGVTSDAFHGNYSREAERMYGIGNVGTGVFDDGFRYSLYLPTGSYYFEGYAKTALQDSYFTPLATSLLADGYAVDNVTSPGTSWQRLSGNFTVNASATIQLDVVFRVLVSGSLYNGGDGYYIDDLLVRKWCNPEPTHSQWGTEQTTSDTRGSGVDAVILHYRVNDGEWANVSMTFKEDTWWNTTIPGQPGNSTVGFYVTATDKAGNMNSTGIDSYIVKPFLLGDINGDGIVNMWDIATTARHFMEHYP
jgi:hypothetical protein